jgi:hypothetical protein
MSRENGTPRRPRREFTPEQKATILRRHLAWGFDRCWDHHDFCTEQLPCEPACLALLEQANANGAIEDLRRGLQLYPTQVLYNKERRAIQFLDCSNATVEHLPVTESVARALEDEPKQPTQR